MNTSCGYGLSKANAFKPCRWLKGGLMPHAVSTLMLPPMILPLLTQRIAKIEHATLDSHVLMGAVIGAATSE